LLNDIAFTPPLGWARTRPRAAFAERDLYRLALWTIAAVLVIAALLVAAAPAVPRFMAAQQPAIAASAQRHGVPSTWLAAVLYNEMLGTEDRWLYLLLPGEDGFSQTMRDGLLGLHFLTIKRAWWGLKALADLAGADTTLGPACLRVSVGREIRAEVPVTGGTYQAQGLWERPSLIRDLSDPSTAIEYLAANLARGQRRLTPTDHGDWAASARWQNTGLLYRRPDVPAPLWEKGSRYVAQVEAFLPRAVAWRPAFPAEEATTISPDALASRLTLLRPN
jgi:hypothetical protein